MPKTGRTHQIRVHLNAIHHPVYGDKLYGKKKDIFNLNRHFLHASKIEFILPSNKPISVISELPKELSNLLNRNLTNF
jgi:23S rRNA pseudouridine1911/1915/1917 synthase